LPIKRPDAADFEYELGYSEKAKAEIKSFSLKELRFMLTPRWLAASKGALSTTPTDLTLQASKSPIPMSKGLAAAVNLRVIESYSFITSLSSGNFMEIAPFSLILRLFGRF